MTEKDIFESTDTLIGQIEDMLRAVAGHQIVSASEMQDGLLDLLLSAKALNLAGCDGDC